MSAKAWSGVAGMMSVASSMATAQSASLRVLIPNASDTRAVGLPSLHEGVYAGYGSRRSDGAQVIFAGRLSDPAGTPPIAVAASGDPVPNRPDRTFRTRRAPTVWDQAVYFSGNGRSTPNPADGLYRGTLDGAPLGVLSDYFNGLGPWIEGPFAGAEGVAYVNREATSGSGAGISLYTYDRQWVPVAAYFQQMPDGSLLQFTGNSTVAIAGGKIAYSARCTFLSSDAGYGVYSYDIASGQTNTIANWTTPIPGDGRPMEFAMAVDTDGQEVVFVASAGFIPFGGTAAVCVANVDGSNLRAIASYGEPVPGLPGRTFRNLGRVAVDSGIVYFQGTYVEGVNERTSLFAHVDGVTIPVILYNQDIEGVTGNTPWFDPRGVSGPDVVVMCEAPTEFMGVSIYTLVHVHIQRSCATDFDGDGFVTGADFDLFVQVFEAGGTTADFDGDGFISGPDFDLYVAAYEAGC